MEAFVTSSQVVLGCGAASREEALRVLAEKGVECGFAHDTEALYQAFLDREAIAETGLTNGFAVPHAKSAAITQAGVVVLKLTQPVEWPSFDQQPVDIALALYVPDGEAGTTHLRLLSKAAVMLMDEGFRNKLRASEDPGEIAVLINEGLA